MSRFKIAFVATTALITNTLISTAALAAATQQPIANAADQTTLDAMKSQCDAIALGYGLPDGQNDHWTGEVAEGAVDLVAGPTEVDGTRVIDEGSILPVGDFVPSVKEIRGDPYRTGGSVNLFGDQWATAGYYPDSTYNYAADFNSTFAHSFDCNVYQEVYHPATEGSPVQGYYQLKPTAPPTSNACNAFNAQGPTWDNWGEDQQLCEFVKTADAVDPQPERWDDRTLQATIAGTPVNQDQTDSLAGFEEHGGRVDVTGEYFIGQVVICISPGPKGGSWKPQNNYSGGSMTGPAAGCNTPYFKSAPWGSGSQTSQGTWISVPDYHLY